MIVNLKVTKYHEFKCPWVYKESMDGLITAGFCFMWMMGDLFALQKYCVGKSL